MKNQEQKALFKNEVELEKLHQAMFLKKFSWEEKISTMTKFVERLEDEGIKYAIQTNSRFKCQNIFISEKDKDKGIIEE